MADIFNDNFETGDLSKWTSSYSATVEDAAAVGLSGDYCAFLDYPGSRLNIDLAAYKSEVYLSFDLVCSDEPGNDGHVVCFSKGAIQVDVLGSLVAPCIGTQPNRYQLTAWKGIYITTGVLLGTYPPTPTLEGGVKYNIQVRYKPHLTDGIFQVKVDGVLVIDFAGSTAPSADPVSYMKFGSIASDSFWYFLDNVVIDDADWPALPAPDPDEYAASDGVVLGGECEYVDSVAAAAAAASDFAAGTVDGSDGKFDGLMLGGRVAFDALLPQDVYSAAGGFQFGGIVPMAPGPRSDYLAAGYLILGGQSVLATSAVDLLETGFAASKGFQFGGKAAYGDGEATADPLVTAYAADGGFRLGTLAFLLNVVTPTDTGRAFAATGGFAFGGSIDFTPPVAPPVFEFVAGGRLLPGLVFGGSSASVGFLKPLAMAFAAAGGFVLGPPGDPDEADVFEAWVLSGQAFEPSIFSAFRFNSFAQKGTQSYAAGAEGIFLLEGDDDDGEAYHTGARIGPANFGADRDKRMRGIQLGNCGPATKVRVAATDGNEGVFTPDRDTNRVVASRNIQGREFVIDIMDFIELSHFEAPPLKLARR